MNQYDVHVKTSTYVVEGCLKRNDIDILDLMDHTSCGCCTAVWEIDWTV